jgi:hypothetical protein
MGQIGRNADRSARGWNPACVFVRGGGGVLGIRELALLLHAKGKQPPSIPLHRAERLRRWDGAVAGRAEAESLLSPRALGARGHSSFPR